MHASQEPSSWKKYSHFTVPLSCSSEGGRLAEDVVQTGDGDKELLTWRLIGHDRQTVTSNLNPLDFSRRFRAVNLRLKSLSTDTWAEKLLAPHRENVQTTFSVTKSDSDNFGFFFFVHFIKKYFGKLGRKALHPYFPLISRNHWLKKTRSALSRLLFSGLPLGTREANKNRSTL